MIIFGLIAGIATAVVSAVTTICAAIAPHIPTILKGLEAVAKIAGSIAQVLGILRPGEQIEDIGDRALQAEGAGIVPDGYDSFDDYMQALRSFPLDPEKSAQYDLKDKQIAGIAVTCRGMEEKYSLDSDTSVSLMAMAAVSQSYFTSERIITWLNDADLDKGKLVAMFDNSLTAKETMEMEDKIISLDRQLDPEAGIQQLENNLEQARESWENR